MAVATTLGSLVLLLLQSTPVCGMIHNLSVQKDARRVFQIESFGFREGGFMNLTVSGFSVRFIAYSALSKVGFSPSRGLMIDRAVSLVLDVCTSKA